MTRVVCVGAGLQEAYLSHSAVFKPVHEGSRGDFTEIKLGDNVEVEKVDLQAGGAALNAAITFARHGLHASFMGTIGHDVAGQVVLDVMDREDIDRSLVNYSHKHHTGYVTVLVAPSGERTLLAHQGAAAEVGDLDIQSLIKMKPDWIYITGLAGGFDVLRKLIDASVKAGIKIAFRPSAAELRQASKLKPLLEDVDWLISDRAGISQIVSGGTLDELLSHALNLVKGVAITAGADGSIVSDGKAVVRAGIYEDSKVVDKAGAGDAFGAGLLAALLTGKNLADAVIFASANATSVLSRLGGNTGILGNGVELHQMPVKETKLR